MSALTVVSDSNFEFPALIARAGKSAAQRFLEFFTVNIRNPNTRAAYGRAAGSFLRWCDAQGLAELRQVQPVHVAAYVEELGASWRPPPSNNISPAFACSSIG